MGNQARRQYCGPPGLMSLFHSENPAGHAFDILETLLAENLRELHGSAAAFAVDDDLLVLVAFEFAEALGELLQRDQLGAGDGGDGLLVGQPAIDEDEILRAYPAAISPRAA